MADSTQPALRDKKYLPHQLAALANKTRLDCMLVLVEAETDGMFATEIANKLKTAKNTMSVNFKILETAGLIVGHRRGRQVAYRVNMEALAKLMTTLNEGLLQKQTGTACAT